MPKTAIMKIFGVSEDACLKTGKTDHVAEVQVGKYTYPLYVGPGPHWDLLQKGTNNAKAPDSKTGGRNLESVSATSIQDGSNRKDSVGADRSVNSVRSGGDSSMDKRPTKKETKETTA